MDTVKQKMFILEKLEAIQNEKRKVEKMIVQAKNSNQPREIMQQLFGQYTQLARDEKETEEIKENLFND